MKKYLLTMFCCYTIVADAQIRIDGNFPFQTDPAKQYSLYIPSGYSATIPHRLMLALHPFNTATWNSISWCDTLAAFAESNNLILVCPDGGPDGMIDDPIDTAFTSALLDSMMTWYNIDSQKIYVMGFSWGGRTTYTYGLSHWWRFGGFIPIGAAVNGTNEVSGIIQNANGKPFFLVHGALDNASVRFYPIRTALIANNAIEKDTLMPGVGHTINFPNRNLILTMAFSWVDSVNCAQLTSGMVNDIRPGNDLVYPNPAATEIFIQNNSRTKMRLDLFNSLGQNIITVDCDDKTSMVDLSFYPNGIYYYRLISRDQVQTGRIIKQQ